MPGSNIRLPKVTQYVRNVGKSIAFASINVVKDNMEGIKGFADDNEDVFVEIYSGVKNYRDTIKKAERSIKDSNLFKAIEYGAKNLVEDAKTGNFYNDRTSEISESALGLDDDSLGLNFDYEVSGGSSSQTSGSKFIADTFSDAIKSSTVGTTTAVAKGTDMVVRSTKASTTILSGQIERSTATIHSGLGAVYNSVNQINQFLNGPMMSHLENSRTYYDNSLKLMQEQHAMMKEMLDMQRNIYSAQAKQYSTSRLDQSMNANGMMNLRGYAKTVKGNLNNILSMYGIDMLSGGSGMNTPMLLAAAPFKIIMDLMFDNLMPKNIKRNLKSFDSIMTGMFGQFIGKMNKNKNDFTSNSFINLLGKLFGIDIDTKTSINTSKYNKGAVAFDGITRKTIVEVIPGYLARIEAALTGSVERHFDPHSGKWRTAHQIEADFEKDRISSIESANRSITYDIANDKRFQSRSYQRSIQKFKERIYEDGYFDAGLTYNPLSRADSKGRRMRSSADNAYKKYGFKDKKTFDAFLSMLSDETIAGLAASNLRAKQDRSRKMQEYEDMGSVFNILFNDTYTDSSKRSGSYSSHSKYATGGLLNRSTDKYGNNVFYYLREILKGINNRWRPDKSNAPSEKGSRRVKVRTSHSRESSTPSSESEDDPGSDDDDNSVWDFVNADFEEEERIEQEKHDKKSAINNWISNKLEKSPLGKFFAGAIGGMSKVFASPLKFVNDMLEKANNNMFSIMFGDMKLEVDGKKVDSVFEFIIEQVKTKFDEIGKYVKDIFNPLWDKFKKWFAPKWDKYGKPVVNQLINYGSRARNRVVTGFDNTIGRAFDTATATIDDRMDDYNEARDFASAVHDATGDRARTVQKAMYDRKMTRDQWKKYSSAIRKARRGEVSSANEVAGTASTEDTNNPGIITQNAFGTRYVTKRGLTMISPGEMIIPASDNPVVLNKMLNKEKQDKNKILNSMRTISSRDISLNAKGTIDTSELRNTLGNIWNENKGENAAKVGAGGIVGLGAGLLTGFNPFLAALAGAGISVLDNSDTLKNIVFGEVADEKTGDRKGGLISKKIQDTFKKYAPDMGDFGIAGGILGLLTPFGPFMGAAIGAGIGFLKNSEGFKKFVFGNEGEDDGIISKKAYDAFKDKVKKAAPKMLLGAGAGILAGPFGLLGNAVIGAGVGLISTTETFQNFLYGEADDNGERHGGVVDAFKTGFLEPAKEKFLEFAIDLKEYSKKHIFEPMKNFWKPVNQMLKNIIQSTGDKIKDHINDMFERTVGLPLHDFLQEKLFKPIGKVVFGILKAPYKIGRAIISAPFRALGGIGNSIRASQIRRGTAYDMTASERLAWREQHGVRFNKFNAWRDKTKSQDEFLAGIGTDDAGMDRLEEIASLSRAGLSSHESLQKAAGRAKKDIGNEVSKYFNTATADARNRFNKVGYLEVKKLTEIAQTKSLADANEFIDKMKGLTDDEKSELKNKIAEKVKAAERANADLATFKTGSDKIDKRLSELLGHKVSGRKDRRKIMRTAEAELKARKRISERVNETPEERAINNSTEAALKKADSIIEILRSIDTTMKNQVFGDVESTKPNGSVNNKTKNATETDSSDTGSRQSTEMTQALDLVRAKEQKAKKGSGLGKVLGWLGIGGSAAAHIDEDSKDAHDAEKIAAEKEQIDIDNTNANKNQVSILTRIKDALVGKKDKEESGGFLGKLWKGLGTVGKWLGIGGLSLTGISLFGHLSQWFKTSVWPDIKTLMFGSDGDSSDGVVGKFAYGVRNYLFGDGTEGNKGIFGNTKDALTSWWEEKASPWLETKINGIATWIDSEGGFTGIFTNRIIPGFINGLGFAFNNLLGPAISAILKAAPSLLAGLGKAIWQGISDAFINRGVGGTRNISIDDGGISAQMDAAIASANSTIESADNTGTVSKIKAAFGNLMPAFKGTGSTTVDLGSNSSNSGNDVNNVKSGGISGLLGQTKRTNTVEFDENGNVTTDYTRFNTTDSLVSYVADAAGRNFIKGLGGARNIAKATTGIGDDILKATGNMAKRGILPKIKGAFGFTSAAAKTGGNIIKTSGNIGSRLNKAIHNIPTPTATTSRGASKVASDIIDTTGTVVSRGPAVAIDDMLALPAGSSNALAKSADNVVAGATDNIVGAAANSSAAKKGILDGITKIFKNIIDNNSIISKIVGAAKTITGKEITEKIVKEAIEKIGAKLGNTLVSRAAGTALKGIGNVIAKFSPLTLATFVIDFIWGFDNAETVLGVAKGTYDINLGHRCICGLVNMLTNFFTLGLLPADVIMDICIEYLFPIFGLDASGIRAAREQAQAAMDEWNKAHPEDTYDNLQDFNNKDKWWFKAGKGISEWWDGAKETMSNSFSAVSTKVKEIANDALDIGVFIKDVTTNVIKSALDPEYSWDIDSYLQEDDPLAGAKKIIYQVLKFPLGIVGVVTTVGKKVYDAIKGFVLDVKDGIKDAWGDISSVVKGKYTVFSSQYWRFNNKDDENPMGIVSKIASTALKVMSMPHAMLGYVGSKIWQGLKAMVSGAKEGLVDASSDVAAVAKGQYTIFSSNYWKSDTATDDNPLSTLGSVFGFVTRLLAAPRAMMGWTVSKAWQGFKALISGAKEGLVDASSDVAAVVKGQYTIFSSEYWKSDTATDDNPLSTLGSVFGFVTRLLAAPRAMMGWTVSKAWQGFKSLISGAKEGIIDASSDISNVVKGHYTIFSSDYWKTNIDRDSENPLSTLGSVFGFITRLVSAPHAMMGYVGSKIKSMFDTMISGAKDISSDTDAVIKKAENGEISVFSDQYWRIKVDENNPLGLLGKIIGYIQRLFNAPAILLKSMFGGIADAWENAKNYFSKILGFGATGHTSNVGNVEPASTYAAASGAYQQNNSTQVVASTSAASYDALNKGGSRSNSHIYQSSGKYANIPYGDSTIGDSGCAPVAAANLLYGRGTASVKDAAKYAERNGLVAPDGGTSIEFFNSYLGSKGISTRNSSDRNTVMNALANGNQVVMLGRDNYDTGAPFGTNPHFITAKGISANGNIIVEDPDLPYDSIEYNPNDVLNSMITSVIAGNGRTDYKLFGKGKEEYDLLANGGYTVSSPYGERWGKMHKGVDLCKANNAPIYAFTNGTVKYLSSGYRPDSGRYGSSDGGGFGNYVTMVDDNGYYHVYAHLNGTNVNEGDIVARNQQIGIQGHTGSSTGSHLHYQITKGEVRGPSVDPYEYLMSYNQSSNNNNNNNNNGTTTPNTTTNSNGASTSSSGGNTTNLITAIGNLGKNLVKKLFGENAYKALYGDDSSTASIDISGNDVADNSSNSSPDLSGLDTTNPGTTMPQTYTTKQIWNALINKGFSKAGAAGIMGNMNAESAYRTNNLQDTYSSKWGLTDEEYSNAVSNGSYGKEKFINDAGGYGLVQFTYHTLKRSLYKHTVEQGLRIDNLQGQINALASQLANSYTSLNNYLKSTTDVASAANKFLMQYENPASPNLTRQKRIDYAWQAYNTYANSNTTAYGRGRSVKNAGAATRALNNVRSGKGSNAVITTQSNAATIDYVSLLKTIIEILISISNNTTLLNRILEILSSKFDINIDADQVTKATSDTTTAQARKALNQLINSNSDSSSMAKLINNKDTQYLLNAMAAIAGE